MSAHMHFGPFPGSTAHTHLTALFVEGANAGIENRWPGGRICSVMRRAHTNDEQEGTHLFIRHMKSSGCSASNCLESSALQQHQPFDFSARAARPFCVTPKCWFVIRTHKRKTRPLSFSPAPSRRQLFSSARSSQKNDYIAFELQIGCRLLRNLLMPLLENLYVWSVKYIDDSIASQNLPLKFYLFALHVVIWKIMILKIITIC